MDRLTEKTPCAGLLPLEIGDMVVKELAPGTITALVPWGGGEKAMAEALTTAHGLDWPAPGRATGKTGTRALWFGLDEVLLIGPAPDPALAACKGGAVVDQSDGWAVVDLSGPGAVQALARLVPVDLRADRFKRGHTARSLLFHCPVSITKTGQDRFMILVFRSMASTLVKDLKRAMQGVAARAALAPE